MAERREGMLAMVGADTREAHTTKRHPAAHKTVNPGAATHMQPGGGKGVPVANMEQSAVHGDATSRGVLDDAFLSPRSVGARSWLAHHTRP